jgi:hypothetical protein
MPTTRTTRTARIRTTLPAALAVCSVLLSALPATADIVVLNSGGQIEGEIVNPDAAEGDSYRIKTARGVLTLRPEQVARIIRQSDAERAYERYLPKMPPTAEGNWLMAEWLRKNGLEDRRERHLEQAIELDPNFEKARYALGYTRVEGRWVKPDEFMEAAGYVKFAGSWKLKQEVEMAAAERRAKDVQQQIGKDLRMWRSWLTGRSPERAVNARAEFAKLNDPRAVGELVRLLETEEYVELRLMYLEVLARINTHAAASALVKTAMEDTNGRVRAAAWEALGEGPRPALAAQLIRELNSKDNKKVNRAAYGLSFIGDESAILPLIDALTTEHKFIINAGQGGTSAGFGTGANSGGGTFSAGGGPKLVEQALENRSVLNALVALTDEPVNFQYFKEGG